MKLVKLPSKTELSKEFVDSVCMSIRHDFGLDKPQYGDWVEILSSGMTENERDELRFQVREAYHAIYKNLEEYKKDELSDFTDKELFNELLKRKANFSALECSLKTINHSITPADLLVKIGMNDENYVFGLFLKKPNGKHIFTGELTHISDEWRKFFPDYFYEASEHVFEYDGDIDDAKKALDVVGIEYIIDNNWIYE